jgi:WD40 repeat protein
MPALTGLACSPYELLHLILVLQEPVDVRRDHVRPSGDDTPSRAEGGSASGNWNRAEQLVVWSSVSFGKEQPVNTLRATLLLTTAVFSAPAHAADPPADAFGDPLPKGAVARLGTVRGGPIGRDPGHLLPDGKTLLLSKAGLPLLHDIPTGRSSAVPGFNPDQPAPYGTMVFAVSGDGTRALVNRGKGYSIMEVRTGKMLGGFIAKTRPGGERRGNWVSLSADGKVLAFEDRAGEVVVWDVEKDVQLARVKTLHEQTVSPVLSPDGKKLATHGTHQRAFGEQDNDDYPDRVVQLWDAATGKPAGKLSGAFEDPADSGGIVLFAPDGNTIATWGGSGRATPIRLWEVATGKESAVILCRSNRGYLAFAPDGKTLAAIGNDGAVDRWSLPDCRPLRTTPLPGRDSLRPRERNLGIAGMRFVSNDRVVVWGAFREATVVWDAPAGKFLTGSHGHIDGIRAVRFGPQDREIVTTCDRCILRWEPTGKLLGEVPVREHWYQLQWSHLGPEGARGLRHAVVYDLRAGEEEFAFPFDWPLPSPDFTRLAGYRRSRDETTDPSLCEVWDVATRRRLCRIELPPKVEHNTLVWNRNAAFSPDNSHLVTALGIRVSKAEVHLIITGWDAKTGKKIAEFTDRDNSSVTAVAVGNNGFCVVATSDGKLRAADYDRGNKGNVIETSPNPLIPVTVPTFSPDGKLLAAGVPVGKGQECAVCVYDWPSGTLLHAFTGHTAPITALAFSSDGKTLASGSQDTTVLLWDLATIEK